MTVLGGNGTPANPLKIGRIVHGCDQEGNCLPMVVSSVTLPDTVSGLVFGKQILGVEGVRQDARPDVTSRIRLPAGIKRPPTWHWPSQCPWNR